MQSLSVDEMVEPNNDSVSSVMVDRSRSKRSWLRCVMAAIAIAAMIGIFTLLRHAWTPPDCIMPVDTLPENAAWLSVDWTSRVPDHMMVRQLAVDAYARRLRYLLPFVSYVRPDGTFNPTYTHAAEFVSVYRSFDKRSRLLAWIGIPVRNTQPFGMHGWVDLADSNERRKIADFAAYLTHTIGFDGVHLDVEPVAGDNAHYLRLLEEVRIAIGTSHLLSVAGNHWQPMMLSRLPFVRAYGWSGEYLQAVAMRADQIVAMAYDSSAPWAALYRFWIREQVRGLNQALVNSPAQLIIGVSVSREVTWTHNPTAENLHNGLAGVCAALSRIGPMERKVAGIAMYASWEADVSDWMTWERWHGEMR